MADSPDRERRLMHVDPVPGSTRVIMRRLASASMAESAELGAIERDVDASG